MISGRPRTLLYFTAYIFLCAAFSLRAQTQDSAIEALMCERVVYDGASPAEVNAALMRKAELCRRDGRYADALDALERVRRYALTQDEQERLLREIFVCSYMDGRFDHAATIAAELGYTLETPLVPKREGLASALSLVPPLGHWYAGRSGEGVLSFVLNAGAMGWTVWQCCSGAWVAGLLGGGIALNYTWTGSQERVSTLIGEYNDKERLTSLEALEKPLVTEFTSSR